ncbi:ArsC family reductase [Cellvibrio sp. pealriver]|uniref:ArsC family reductase n=1 Tax=Cellvibrio sp. pealriver TaxID=1622269 RepID=UPI00066FD8DA|nr:ArsC family reductase [Cellvibrio sp. pealriver]
MITLYGIKNCDTVKKARTWLEKNAITYQFHDFRADGLEPQQIKNWIDALGLDALVNKRSTTWKELDDATKQQFTADAVNIILANPTLIKRPLLDTGKQQYVGFKETEYRTLFN